MRTINVKIKVAILWWHISAPCMQENYVSMQDDNVLMQDDYVDMQVTNLFRESDFYMVKITY